MTRTPAQMAALLDAMTPEEKRQYDALIAAEKRARANAGLRLYEFIPTISPTYSAPKHLDPLVQALEASWTRPVRRTAHAPPRFAKTDTVLAFVALTLKKQPHRTLAYVTYEDRTAKSKSRKARQWAQAGGVELADDVANLNEWRTKQGGGVLATGIGGPLTSQGVDILLVDDPYKNRIQAESAAYRSMVADWWGDVAETRIEPGGSAFIFHTRWVDDDLIGHVLNGEDKANWEHINMPALNAKGESLWPERWPVDLLQQKQRSVGPYTWASLFQGEPRARGSRVFQGVHFYTQLPETFSEGFGVDLSYTRKTYSDRSICVGLVENGGYWYLTTLRRRQVRAPAFGAELRAIAQAHPSAGFRWYCSGTELGSADFMLELGVPLHAMTTTADKFIRAQPVAAMWNAGRILLPRELPPGMAQEDLDEFVRVVCGFTGVGDDEDDDVDALAAAFDQLPETAAPSKAVKPGTVEAIQQEQERILERAMRRARGEEDEW